MSKNKSSSISIWNDFSEKIESLREALNTPIDENDSSGKSSTKSDLLDHYSEKDAVSLGTFDIESLRKALNTPIDDMISSGKSILPDKSTLLPQNYENDVIDASPSDNETEELDEVAPSNMTDVLTENVEKPDIVDKTDLEDEYELNNQIPKTHEPDKLDYVQENQDIEEAIDTNEEVTDTNNETDSENINVPNSQVLITDESDRLDHTIESQDEETKVNTEQPLKNEKIDIYWKRSETPNPYILKVDESRERLNRSLEMARELVNKQSEEPQKQEKKRFQLRFTRGEKNENNKSSTVKDQEKRSKKSIELKPMVYEMLEPKQEDQTSQTKQPDQDNKNSQDNQPKQVNQTNQGKQDKEHKGKTKQSSDRAKNSQEKEIINHRNRLEKSKSLGVPVFVKKPANLEQIRQLKSMLTSQNDLKILVDTGSSQGRMLVISGQDPDTLLDTLTHLSTVKSTSVEDETINIVL
ncbi:MAG TPA: hypothetical protein G4O15_04375 [Dehalococcoidia bacterium]|nr:hypothetical protein [Dehalococcoidia bacterium]